MIVAQDASLETDARRSDDDNAVGGKVAASSAVAAIPESMEKDAGGALHFVSAFNTVVKTACAPYSRVRCGMGLIDASRVAERIA